VKKLEIRAMLADQTIEEMEEQLEQAARMTLTSHQKVGPRQRGWTYIESDRIASSAPMESADQAARAVGRASTTMVVMARPLPMQPEAEFFVYFEFRHRLSASTPISESMPRLASAPPIAIANPIPK